MHERSFGRYELIERIDIGGMAEVFKATLRGAAGFQRVLAIKRILPQIAADPDVIRMFVAEAKLAVQLSHPNIAQIYELGEVDGSYFIAMEYVDGHSLKTLGERWSERDARLPPAAVCHVLAQVAEGLHYAHFASDVEGRPLGLIHRDVSPQNILLSFGGEVKVIDFGLAKAENRASETRDGVVKGKLAYLSPEQAHGRTIDRRSDLFSLGICAWELLTGRRAFKRDDDRETVLAIRAGRVEPPSRYATLPAELERIVQRALAVDPDARYRTALELREDLDGFAKRSRYDFGRRDLQALMRQTFPERFAREPGADGAFELVQKKKTKSAAPPPLPTPSSHSKPSSKPGSMPAPPKRRAARPPTDTVVDSMSDPKSDTETHDDFADRTEPRQDASVADAEDTVPGISLPDDRD